jgi:uncharacterized protein (DUF488 family)
MSDEGTAPDGRAKGLERHSGLHDWSLDSIARGTRQGAPFVRSHGARGHNPQFNGDALGPALRAVGLEYVQVPRLGGLRRARKDSRNTGWRNASFRGFADYMATEEFEAGLAELRAKADEGRVAIMCAEAVPWRCHRSLVADALIARGAEVEHITSIRHSSPHHMTPFAKVSGARVTYPGE